MRILSVAKSFFKQIYKTPNSKQVKQIPLTTCFTDVSTGIVRMERPIKRNGKEALAIMEKFPDGKIKTTIQGGGEEYWRTKTITREQGTSVFGGNRIIVEKDLTAYFCYGENIKLSKDYNPNGIMEHVELLFRHDSGNGLNDYKHSAILDRVYKECSLSHSVKEMLKSPSEHKSYQHALDKKNNYNNFANRQTNYEHLVKAQEQAKIDAEIKANEAVKAAKEAEKKALQELRKKQPRINVAKVLGINVDELKVVEKVQPNGAIKRYYFLPETGFGKRKPVITTYDHGLLHTEKIIGSTKADMIYLKQIGDEKPYILAKKGNYTQVSKFDNEMRPDRIQYYNDGIYSLKRTFYDKSLDMPNGKVNVYDEKASEIIKNDAFWAKEYSNYPSIRVVNGEIQLPKYDGWYPVREKYNKNINDLNKDAQDNFIDLKYLFKDYEV